MQRSLPPILGPDGLRGQRSSFPIRKVLSRCFNTLRAASRLSSACWACCMDSWFSRYCFLLSSSSCCKSFNKEARICFQRLTAQWTICPRNLFKLLNPLLLIHLLFLLGAHSLKPMLPSAPGWLQSGSPRHPGHPILPAADRVLLVLLSKLLNHSRQAFPLICKFSFLLAHGGNAAHPPTCCVRRNEILHEHAAGSQFDETAGNLVPMIQIRSRLFPCSVCSPPGISSAFSRTLLLLQFHFLAASGV